MKAEYQKIYRVMHGDRQIRRSKNTLVDKQINSSETYWCTDKKACQEYIDKSEYKDCLYIEESILFDIPLKCV